jgi:hypothetical protein
LSVFSWILMVMPAGTTSPYSFNTSAGLATSRALKAGSAQDLATIRSHCVSQSIDDSAILLPPERIDLRAWEA